MNSEIASEMEVDAEIMTPRERSQKGAILFSRSEQLSVTLHAHVPMEVEEVLGNAGNCPLNTPIRNDRL